MGRKLRQRLIDTAQHERPNKQLLKLAENILRGDDIKARKRFWQSEIIVFDQWDEWDRDYFFLPMTKKYQDIIFEYKKKVQEIANNKGEQLCYILRKRNNVFTVATQNMKSYNFNDPRIVIFMKNPLHERDKRCLEEAKTVAEGQHKGACLGWCRAMMYIPVYDDEINVKMGYCILVFRQDECWSYHGNYMNSSGIARVQRSQIFKDNDSLACYSYCRFQGRPKNAIPKLYIEGKTADDYWQPQWGMLQDTNTCPGTATEAVEGMAGTVEGGYKYGSFGINKEVSFPNNLQLKKYSKIDGRVPQAPAMPINLFLVDKDHYDTNPYRFVHIGDEWNLGERDSYLEHGLQGKITWYPLPDIFCAFPHLIPHAQVHFLFFKKVIQPADLERCRIETRDNIEWWEGSVLEANKNYMKDRTIVKRLYLKMQIKIRSSVAGIVYHFQSNDVKFRSDLRVTGVVQDQKLLNMFSKAVFGSMTPKTGDSEITGFFKTFGRTLTELGAGLSDKWLGTDFKPKKGDMITGKDKKAQSGTDTNNSEKVEAEKDSALRVSLQTNTIPTGQQEVAYNIDNDTFAGFDSGESPLTGDGSPGESKADNSPPKKSEGTTKKFSTGVAGIARETAKFACNNINSTRYDWTMFEFVNYCMKNPFEIEFTYSDEFFENMLNNNNATVNHSLDVKFKHFQQIIRQGENQMDVRLFWDMNKRYQSAFARGVNVYMDKQTDFTNLVLRRYSNKTSNHGLQLDIDIGGGEERWKETIEPIWKQNSTTTSAGGDNVALSRCGAYLRPSSYLIPVGSDGRNRFPDFWDAIPESDCQNGVKNPREETWFFRVGASNSITINLGGDGSTQWKHRLVGYNRSDGEQVGWGNTATLKYAVTSSNANFTITLEGGGHYEYKRTRTLERHEDANVNKPANIDIPLDNPPSGVGDPAIDGGGIEGISVDDQAFEMTEDESMSDSLAMEDEDVSEGVISSEKLDAQDLQDEMFEDQQIEEEEQKAQEQQQTQDQSKSDEQENVGSNTNVNAGEEEK